jgi:glycosyltransferase involved in cell wall biosynthesis
MRQENRGKTSLKVCILAYTFYEGDARVMRYGKALAGRGDMVDVIGLRREGQPKHELVNGVAMFRLQGRQKNQETGARAYLGGLLTFFLRAMMLLMRRQFSKQTRYDIVHVHSVPDFLVFAAWLPKLMGAKLILDIHDLLPELYLSKYGAKQDSAIYRVLLKLEKLSANYADHVIVANDLWERKLAARAVPKERCSTFINLPDRTVFCRNGRTRKDRKFIMIYPGTLSWHQGLDIAIRAFASVRDQIPAAEFHIYGEGTYREPLLKLIGELEMQHRVFINSFLPLREIAHVIENADLGVEPKRSNNFGNEAFSTKILEFMALGVPVIASDTAIHRFYLDDSLVHYFPGEDEKALADAMVLLTKREDLRNRLIENGLEFIEHHHWDVKKADYLALVDSLTQTNSTHQVLASPA